VADCGTGERHVQALGRCRVDGRTHDSRDGLRGSPGEGRRRGCPEGQQGTFAFTINQTTSTEPGTVTAAFDSGEQWTVGPTYVTKKTREYFVNAYGKLLSASSPLDGKLILNRFWCFPPA
jgi:hypothetical protein